METTLEECFVEEVPERLIGDRAYDSDPLDERLQQKGIELIAPHRRNRKKKATQDGRKHVRVTKLYIQRVGKSGFGRGNAFCSLCHRRAQRQSGEKEKQEQCFLHCNDCVSKNKFW